MDKKLEMVNHLLLDWGVFSKDNGTILKDYKVVSWAVKRIGRLEEKPANRPLLSL